MAGFLSIGLCLLFTAVLFSLIRMAARFDTDRWQLTLVNYAVAACVGLIQAPSALSNVAANPIALTLACCIGALFVGIFYIMAFLTQQVGISYMTIVSKVSLAIPVCFSWLYYGDDLGPRQAVGVALALGAVVLVNIPSTSPSTTPGSSRNWLSYLLAAILFLGCGIGDSLFKVFNQAAANHVAAADFTIAVFTVATLGALVVNLLMLGSGSSTFKPASLWMGLAIGIPNYFSIYFLASSLSHFPGTVFYPIFNTSLLLIMALVGGIVFKERMNKWNLIGLLVTIVAVALLV